MASSDSGNGCQAQGQAKGCQAKGCQAKRKAMGVKPRERHTYRIGVISMTRQGGMVEKGLPQLQACVSKTKTAVVKVWIKDEL